MQGNEHDWMLDYKLSDKQLAVIKDVAIKAERLFKLFNWDWGPLGIPSAFQIEEQYIEMTNDLIKREGKMGDADAISCGRLNVSLLFIDDESKTTGFIYSIELDEDPDMKEKMAVLSKPSKFFGNFTPTYSSE